MTVARSRSTSARPRSHLETEPLLPKEKVKPNPLPKAQLAVIYAIKLTLPIAYTQALPYYNVLIGKLAASEGADTGYYSGVAHSVASVAQFTSMFFWGRVSDSWGRIPVIFLGTSMSAFFTLGFGLTDSLAGLILNRLLGGFFQGITGAIHSVVGELCDETNESIAFPLYDIVSAVGFVIGPLIGGTFENPAKQWPDVFSHPIWERYPYLLPCLISSTLSLVAALLSIFVLEETLPGKRKRLVVDEEPVVAATSSDATTDIPEEDVKPHSVKQLLSIPVLRAVFASSSALGFAGSSFNSGFILMAYTPLEQGGLALSPSQIGRALSGMGAVSIPLKLCMPVLLQRFGTLNVFDFSMLAWSACFLSMPLASLIAQASIGTTTPIDGLVNKYREGSALEWASVALTLFLSRLGCLAFSIIMILTRDHTPGHASLGTANGLAELAQSLAAAVGPTVISSLFAISAKKHLLGGYMWVVFMLILSGFGSWMVKQIRKYRD
ncbi:MFS general substrate transporter [Lentinus tigrinus ALCF2SS1-7]|uniref:MFS general substrate transporter n=1 Tax=Lentinus tigrinus ALCF2SS1-6 TaxID=1328759 RepID=A0A5C2S296_9APHY|nr:MFS general substrate transporter [Lentinus tigrinus ALCF2SS1-6]RPD78777.1 MFS general substrate transporter [Lentinus tigrinus ALCF2SS1-7]